MYGSVQSVRNNGSHGRVSVGCGGHWTVGAVRIVGLLEMSRYYLHIRCESEFIEDDEGAEFG